MKNPENLKSDKKEQVRVHKALEINQPLSAAYYMKEKLIRNWINLANASKIPMLQKFARTLAIHKSGILVYYNHRISTGPLEGTNNKIKIKIKTMKRKDGYRDDEFFKLFDLHNKKYALIG